MALSELSPFLLEIGRRGQRVRLRIGRVIVGRHPRKCQLIFTQPAISRCHCEFMVNRDSVTIRDLSSANGTHLNGERITHSELVDGDCVRVGKAILKLIWTGPPEPGESLPVCSCAPAESDLPEDATEYQVDTLVGRGPGPTLGEPFTLPAGEFEPPESSSGSEKRDDNVLPDRLLDILFDES